ncbi:MAG: HigA family addiction module antitoxin [Acidimicrobiia bacterium]
MPKTLEPVHPGEILMEEFLGPLGISQYRLAIDVSVPPRRINEIVHGKRSITADTALRLARYFGTTERFWLNLQAQFDLDVARDRLGDRLTKEVTEHRQKLEGAGWTGDLETMRKSRVT